MFFSGNNVSGQSVYNAAVGAANEIHDSCGALLKSLNQRSLLTKKFELTQPLFYAHPFIFFDVVCAISKMRDADLAEYKKLMNARIHGYTKNVNDPAIQVCITLAIGTDGHLMLPSAFRAWQQFGRNSNAVLQMYTNEIKLDFLNSVLKTNIPVEEFNQIGSILDSAIVDGLRKISNIKI